MPFQFAENVLRQLAQPDELELCTEGLWLRFGLQALVGVSLVLLAVSLYPVTHDSGEHLLPPPIEYSIVNHSGLL